MNTSKNRSIAPTWLKAVSVIGIIWYAFGLLQFWLGVSMDTAGTIASGTITAAHGAAIENTPALVWIAFALASGFGLLGAALLFKASATAKQVFALSAISAIAYYVWVYMINGTGGDRPAEELYIAVVVVGVTLGFGILSRRIA